jgi:uncharacterized membrane protein YtjA (UPF0391 family)
MNMLKWSFLFLIIALLAGAMGFTGVAGAATAISKTLFFIFIGIWALIILGVFFIFKR